MHREREKGLTWSAALHVLFLLLAYFGLPDFFFRPLPDEPMAITVELLPITGITNVKPAEQPPEPQEKPEEKANPKPSPPVNTAEEKAPPPPAEKLNEKKEEKKAEKKEEKKDKKKSKEEDLAAVLKAVKETAKKQDKASDKDKSKDSDKSKSRSNQYNPEMPLSLSEKDAIRSQIARCWNVPAGAKDAHELIVALDIELAEDGSVIKVALANSSKGRYNRDSFFRAAADSAIRAVRQCSPLKNLPPEKYQTWREMELTFDPKEMLF